MTELDAAACYRALQTRDARFDGRFFVAVTTTRIYCRPVCPATTARRDHCRFFPSAAAAQEAGFRPCLRCRPETAPEHAAWHGTSNTVSRALALIADGELDGDDADVEELAARLGVGERHLRRLFEKHLGASPSAVAQTRRVLFAKHLIHETSLKMSEIAFASGFGSVRRFNETFQRLYEKPPSALRRKSPGSSETAAGGVTLRLRYRPPYDWESMLSFLAARALGGVERVEDGRYARTFREDGEVGTVEVAHAPRDQSLRVTIRGAFVRGLPRIVNRVRRVFDLGADVSAIGAHLTTDPRLAPLIRARPGLRVAGGWDAAVRDPDAFPAGDRGLVRGYALATGRPASAAELTRSAERWRPFRAYAAQHLWAADSIASAHQEEVRRAETR